MFNKILTINKNMVSSGRKDAALNPSDESTLSELRAALESNKPVPQFAMPLLVRILTQWPYSDRLAALDLLRCVAKYPLVAQFSDPNVGSLLDLAFASSLPQGETP